MVVRTMHFCICIFYNRQNSYQILATNKYLQLFKCFIWFMFMCLLNTLWSSNFKMFFFFNHSYNNVDKGSWTIMDYFHNKLEQI